MGYQRRVNKTLEHFRLLTKNLIMAAAPVKPQVLWAQRPKIVFLTVNVADLKDPEIKVEKDSLYLKGVAAADKLTYEVTLKFLKEIDPETTKYQVRPRCIEFALEKKEEGPYWERLLADKTKQHWLRVDFSKWKEEDDSDNEGAGGAGGEGGGDLEEMMKNMGGLGGGGMGGMPGMGGMGGMPGMGGMGGMGGMPPGMAGMDLGGMGKPDMDDLDGDSDDEDLPDLE